MAVDYDHFRACNKPIKRPDDKYGTSIQGSKTRPVLECNRPAGHEPPCRVYDRSFRVLAEQKW